MMVHVRGVLGTLAHYLQAVYASDAACVAGLNLAAALIGLTVGLWLMRALPIPTFPTSAEPTTCYTVGATVDSTAATCYLRVRP